MLSWMVIEVDRETALSRVDDITAERLNEMIGFFFDRLYESTFEQMMDLHDGKDDFTDLEISESALPKFKADLKNWLNYYYDVYENKNGYPRNLYLIYIKGFRVMIAGGESWGDTWENLEHLGILGDLRITENTYDL